MFLGEFRFSYEKYHTGILFFKRYVRALAYSILAYARILEPFLSVSGTAAAELSRQTGLSSLIYCLQYIMLPRFTKAS